MYAHDLIEHLTTATPKKLKKVAPSFIKEIQNSIHFFMGEFEDVNKLMDYGKFDGVPYFTGVLGQCIRMPYEYMTMAFTVGKTYLPDDSEAPFEKTETKAIISLVEKDAGNKIIAKLFMYSPYYKSWSSDLCEYEFFEMLNPDINGGFGIVDLTGSNQHAGAHATMLCKIVNSCLFLLNTKNIGIIDNHPPIRLNKKRVKNGRQPLLIYKTITIKPTGRKQESIPKHLWQNKVHLCRGHFKTYTEDNPLFGNVTGRYWWQPHARGNASKGMIVKDYNVSLEQAV